jgi:hypothetical protein
VPGARDRQEFRQALDYSQYQGFDCNYEIHVPANVIDFANPQKKRPGRGEAVGALYQ